MQYDYVNRADRPTGRTRIIPDLQDRTFPRFRSLMDSLFAPRLRLSLGLLSLVVIAVVPYANTLGNDFVYDDVPQIVSNPLVQSVHSIGQIFTTSVVPPGFQGSVSNYYRPMMSLEYLLCYKLFGFAPYGFHLANIVLHTAAVLLVFCVTSKVFRQNAMGFLAAIAFALHPIHSESVAWVAAVTDLELTLFYLLTFWLFLRIGEDHPRSVFVYTGMAVSFVFALLSKEQALTLPLVATIYEHFYRSDRSETDLWNKILRYGWLWLIAVAYLVVRWFVLDGLAPYHRFPELRLQEIVLSAIALVGQYAWKLFWPVHLCAFYVFHKAATFVDAQFAIGVLAGLLSLILFRQLWMHARMVSLGIIWLFATLTPVLNAHWVGDNVFCERYLYLPSVGFCWIVAFAAQRFWRMTAKRHFALRAAMIAAVSILGALSVFRIVTRNRDWRNDHVFYARTLQTAPDAAPILNEYGLLLSSQGQYEQAAELFVRAMRVDPRLTAAHFNLGSILMKMGSLQDAETEFEAAGILVQPGPATAALYSDLGNRYVLKGDRSHAENAFKRALSMNPFDTNLHLQLAGLYATSGRTADAVLEYERILRSDPMNSGAARALQLLQPSKPSDLR